MIFCARKCVTGKITVFSQNNRKKYIEYLEKRTINNTITKIIYFFV